MRSRVGVTSLDAFSNSKAEMDSLPVKNLISQRMRGEHQAKNRISAPSQYEYEFELIERERERDREREREVDGEGRGI